MRLLPGIDLNELDYDLTKLQAIIIALIAYISIAAYIFLLAFECHNVYFYLYKQKKYKVYPVTLFYANSSENLSYPVKHCVYFERSFCGP